MWVNLGVDCWGNPDVGAVDLPGCSITLQQGLNQGTVLGEIDRTKDADQFPVNARVGFIQGSDIRGFRFSSRRHRRLIGLMQVAL